ncbi:MAG: hypothetical protein ACE3JK_16705 [Sporolactobacillus sp.]
MFTKTSEDNGRRLVIQSMGGGEKKRIVKEIVIPLYLLELLNVSIV